MTSDGTLKITDFGLVKVGLPEEAATEQRAPMPPDKELLEDHPWVMSTLVPGGNLQQDCSLMSICSCPPRTWGQTKAISVEDRKCTVVRALLAMNRTAETPLLD